MHCDALWNADGETIPALLCRGFHVLPYSVDIRPVSRMRQESDESSRCHVFGSVASIVPLTSRLIFRGVVRNTMTRFGVIPTDGAPGGLGIDGNRDLS